jgi:hypothetical protein
MKKLLFIATLLVLLSSCTNTRHRVVMFSNGTLANIGIRGSYTDFVNVGDTIVVACNPDLYGYSFHGLYTGIVPEIIRYDSSYTFFSKVRVIK